MMTPRHTLLELSRLGERPAGLALREYKGAAAKLGLLAAAIARIAVKPFAEVTVAELCEAAGVSEQTFFNYFPRKGDLLLYYVALWLIEAPCRAGRAVRGARGLRFIEALFDVEARGIAERPRLMFEIVVWKALQGGGLGPFPAIPAAERRVAFPDLPEALDSRAVPLPELLRRQLRFAVRARELPAATRVEPAASALFALFYGVPLAHGVERAGAVRAAYRRQLALLWDGLRAAGRRAGGAE